MLNISILLPPSPQKTFTVLHDKEMVESRLTVQMKIQSVCVPPCMCTCMHGWIGGCKGYRCLLQN